MSKQGLFFLMLTNLYLGPWHTNLTSAKKEASRTHKYILLNFSGSDWCGPCIRLKKEIFESNVFVQMADTTLVLVNADFPRNKKNQLPAEQQHSNDSAADQYNKEGKFPLTVLMTAEGKVIHAWDGLPAGSAETFTTEVRNLIYTNQSKP